jgi:plasmid stabilization system protein ParE
MTYRVEIADQVDRDADAILEWLHSQHATDAAVAWFRGLGEAIDSLAQFPSRCPLAHEDREFDFEVRQLLYGRKPHIYRVLFTIEGDVVRVLHIRHGRRKPGLPSAE